MNISPNSRLNQSIDIEKINNSFNSWSKNIALKSMGGVPLFESEYKNGKLTKSYSYSEDEVNLQTINVGHSKNSARLKISR
jgi:hypothetical protein